MAGSLQTVKAVVVAAVVLALLVLAPVRLAFAAPPDLNAFLMPEELADATISPNGRRYARLDYIDGRSRLTVRPFDASEGAAPTAFNLGDIRAIWVDWANDERLVVGIIVWSHILNVANLPYIRVVAVNPDGSNPVVLFNDAKQFSFNTDLSNLIHSLPDRPNEVLMGATGADGSYNAYRVNVMTGAATLEEAGTGDTLAWVPDGTGILRVRIDQNAAQRLRRVYAREGTGDAWRLIAEYSTDRNPEMRVLGPTEDPTIFLVQTTHGHDKAGLHLYDLRQNRITGTYYQREDYDTQGAVGSSFSLSPLAAFYLSEKPSFDFFDKATQKKIHAVLSHLDPTTALSFMDMDRSGRRWIIETQGPLDPGTFYQADLETGRLTAFGKRRPALSNADLAPAAAYTYKARDGLTVPAYLTLPAGREARHLPLIVMPHGGPEARDVMQFDAIAQFVASRGYAVFQPNFRGSDGYGRRYAALGYGEWGGKMQTDLIDGLNDLIARGIADKSRVCMVGGSYGGYAALIASIQTPELFKCVVSIAGVTDLPDTIENVRRDYGADSGAYAYVRHSIGRWPEESQKLIALSPARNADKVKVPVLIIHGVQDDVVPIEQAIKMRDALLRAGKPVSYLQMERSGHHSTHPQDLQQMLVALDLFLARHLTTQFSSLDAAAPPLSLTARGFTERYGAKAGQLGPDAGTALEDLHQLPVNLTNFTSRGALSDNR